MNIVQLFKKATWLLPVAIALSGMASFYLYTFLPNLDRGRLDVFPWLVTNLVFTSVFCVWSLFRLGLVKVDVSSATFLLLTSFFLIASSLYTWSIYGVKATSNEDDESKLKRGLTLGGQLFLFVLAAFVLFLNTPPETWARFASFRGSNVNTNEQ